MMLRNLIDEVRNRRVLALAALAVLVALAVPLLFLKGAPEGAPAANSAAPAPPAEAKLPARAARLLATSDPGAPGNRATGSAQDPFAPPAAYRTAAAAAANGSAGATTNAAGSASASKASATSSSTKPIPVVIENASPKKSSISSKSNSKSNSNSKTTTKTTRTIAVDIRYGKKKDSPIKRAIPRNKAFYIHGKLVAMFVKYSPSRKKAIFAVAPGLHISGPVTCRVENNACRYLDMPVGSHAYLTMITANRTIVKRRLDVVHARSVISGTATPAALSAKSACLLGKLAAMQPGDRFLDRDACEL